MTSIAEGRGETGGRRRFLLEEFLELDDGVFLAEAFQKILGREPDPESYRFFDRALRVGTMSRTEVLGHLRNAPEGRWRGVRIQGLAVRFWVAKLSRRLKSSDDREQAGRAADIQPTGDLSAPDPFSADEAALLNELGLGPSLPLAVDEAAYWSVPPSGHVARGSEDRSEQREGLAFATLCTVSHLPAARAMLASVYHHHPDAGLYLLLVDGGRNVVLPCPAHVLVPSDLNLPRFPFLALKYTALDLCCALKPYLLRHLLDTTGHAKLVYLDSDIVVFRRMEELTAQLDDAQFVITPHMVAPPESAWPSWERPSLGDFVHSGVFNAGMFGLSDSDGTRLFLDQLCELVTAPGAFQVPGQTEQHSFNWITAFCENVAILRDTTYNVAYWNLHDRSLRDRRLDCAEAPASWTVDGRPLAAFHFSGFSSTTVWALSKYDGRYSTHVLPSVRSILDHYCDLLRQQIDPGDSTPYRYGHWPSGGSVDDRMRSIFREYEAQFDRDVNPWSEAGETYYAGLLMRPMPGSGSLLPILWDEVYRTRPDLQALFPKARTEPVGMLRWAATEGVREYGYERLHELHRFRSPSSTGARRLLAALSARGQLPTEGWRGRVDPTSRRELLDCLRDCGEAGPASETAALNLERVETTLVGVVRVFLEHERPDLAALYPDPLFKGAAALASWLAQKGERGYLLPEGSARAFGRCADGRSLARIFSFVNAHWRLAAQFPLVLVGEDRFRFAEFLLRALRTGCQYDVEDVAMYLWAMTEKPWAGLALTFELLPNLGGEKPPWTPEGQEALLGSLLAHPGFGAELASYRERHPSPVGAESSMSARQRIPISVFDLMGQSVPETAALPSHRASEEVSTRPVRRAGVNIFGYFQSPIGLGMLSRGVAAAIELAGMPVAKNLLGNVAMDEDVRPEDFVRQFDFGLNTNLFCSYPHFDELLLDRLPAAMVEGRRNIVYLAWEQRDGMTLWRRIYQQFDQVWALSEFAAQALRRHIERDVLAVPCVVDFESLPSPARKREVGLDEGRYSFLFVFDANSSVERKNPSAVIEAFSRAFADSHDVELVIKISNAARVEHRERLQRLVGSAIRQGSRVRVLASDLPRLEVLRLISAADCYVSLHRAEGFGYTCAEAMAYGKPVIATGYSGNLEFMNEENSFLVSFREVEVSSAEGPFPRGSVWAEPDLDHAAILMRHVVASSEIARRKGETAARDIRAVCSTEAVARLVSNALDRLGVRNA